MGTSVDALYGLTVEGADSDSRGGGAIDVQYMMRELEWGGVREHVRALRCKTGVCPSLRVLFVCMCDLCMYVCACVFAKNVTNVKNVE